MENQRDTEHRLRRKSGAVLSMFFWKRPRDGGNEKEGRDCERDSWRNRSLHYRSSRRDRVPRGEEARKGTQGITPRNDTQCPLWPVSVPHSHLFNVTCNIIVTASGGRGGGEAASPGSTTARPQKEDGSTVCSPSAQSEQRSPQVACSCCHMACREGDRRQHRLQACSCGSEVRMGESRVCLADAIPVGE